MGYYLMQGSYAVSSIKGMVSKPEDRTGPVEKLVKSAGGKLHHFFFAMGESDWVVLCEAPDDAAAAAISMAVGASGGIASFKTTKLMTATEAMAAMTKAKSISYTAPGA